MSTARRCTTESQQAPEKPAEQVPLVILNTPAEDDPRYFNALAETLARLASQIRSER